MILSFQQGFLDLLEISAEGHVLFQIAPQNDVVDEAADRIFELLVHTVCDG